MNYKKLLFFACLAACAAFAGCDDAITSGNNIIPTIGTDGNGDPNHPSDPSHPSDPNQPSNPSNPPNIEIDPNGDLNQNGILDGLENLNPQTDTDGDSVPDYLDPDANGNGIPDKDEVGSQKDENGNIVPLDTDGDGVPDYLDLDIDGDGIPNVIEIGTQKDENGNIVPLDTDGDGIPDYLDTDSDNDGIPDKFEGTEDFDNDGLPNYRDTDSTGNKIVDPEDPVYTLRCFVNDNDSDGDCVPDSIEKVQAQDDEGNLLQDENGNPVYRDTDGDGVPDYLDNDSDGDGILDREEFFGTPRDNLVTTVARCNTEHTYADNEYDAFGTLEKPFDCDSDGIPDYLDIDSDNDGLLDKYEANLSTAYNTEQLARYTQDSDKDGMNDGFEACHKLDKPLKEADCSTVTTDNYMHCCQMPDLTEDRCHLLAEPLNDDATCKDGITQENFKNCCEVSVIGAYPTDFDQDETPDFLDFDSDNDGLFDVYEVDCGAPYGHSARNSDTDGDDYSDMAEYAASKVAELQTLHLQPRDLICDPNKYIKKKSHDDPNGYFNFFFQLDEPNKQEKDVLTFIPQVSKLDVVFNLDTTGSMGHELTNLVQHIASPIVPSIQREVPGNSTPESGTAFGITAFDDFPVGGYGDAGKDLPFELIQIPTTNIPSLVKKLQPIEARGGNDDPESGMEALYQIVTGAGVNWSGGKIDPIIPEEGRWGGAQFRNNSFPVVIHVTDAPTHDKDFKPYDSNLVPNAHYKDVTLPIFKQKGVKLITIRRGSRDQQLLHYSTETDTIVPACAFKQESGHWLCGENQCCVLADSGQAPEARLEHIPSMPEGNNACVLSYSMSHANQLNKKIVQGLTALVKYSRFKVTTRVKGRAIEGTTQTTDCFIKKIEALEYIAPPQEPEASCTPQAQPYKETSADYNDAFQDFAMGTAKADRIGSKLTFDVVAQNLITGETNTTCVEESSEPRAFFADIEVYDPVTNLVLDTQPVMVIIPANSTSIPNVN